MNLKELILNSRTIKENSLRAYLISLKKLNNNKEIESLDYLKDTSNIVEKINNFKIALSTKRNYYGAILVALGTRSDDYENDKLMLFYKEKLQIINDEYNADINEHRKTKKQEENWASLKELAIIRNKFKNHIRKEKYREKTQLTYEERNHLTYYLVISLYTLIEPVRLDYAPMSIVTDLADDDNETNFLYIKSRTIKKFILNEYKTFNKYGKKIIDIPPELNSVINLYLKFHSVNNSFLMNFKNEPLKSTELTLLIPKAFSQYTDKHITLNLLRHIYCTEKIELKDPEQLAQEVKIASNMCHSLAIQQKYIKINPHQSS
tara:strand:- start:43 stop:1002 length:960 start_codon:yes stop_codon:yes gene_type:complete